MTDDTTQVLEDQQILQETVANERIVTHPRLGTLRFTVPTLATQRKIDEAVRAKRKQLLNTTITINDPEAPGGKRKVPAFKSKEVLAQEYMELGWWTAEQEVKRQELSKEQVKTITELELLGFDSDGALYEQFVELREDFLDHFKDHEELDSLTESIFEVTTAGATPTLDSYKILRDKALSTDVDEWIEELTLAHRMYELYTELVQQASDLAEIETEYMSLFNDSWQEQLQYYQRLAQVYHCVQYTESKESLWKSLDGVEEEEDVELIRWVFTELNAFWQGLTEETRERMNKYSFMPRLTVEQESSDGSQSQPDSKNDGDSQESEPISSTPVSETSGNSQSPN
jgi:hypothetical protein